MAGKKRDVKRSTILAILVVIIATVSIGPVDLAGAQEGETAEESVVEVLEAPAVETMSESAEPFQLSEEQVAQLEAMTLASAPEGPDLAVSSDAVEGPAEGTETGSPSATGPLADGTFSFFRKRNFSYVTTANYKSHIAEVSVDGAGRYLFAAWNWGAARSINGGHTWTYVSPWSGMTEFCCDQVVIYDKARDLLLWLRQGTDNGTRNRYKLSASTNGGATWTSYNIWSPNTLWFDYPHMAVGTRYLYIAYNVYTVSGDSWTRTEVRRISLDNLRDGASLTTRVYRTGAFFNATPVQGASDTMYWGTHSNTSNFRISRWPESGTTVYSTIRSIPAWTSTPRGSARCAASGANWAARTDHRVLSGVLADGYLYWFWNVQEGSGFTYPYTNAAKFRESNRTYVSRPYVYHPSFCWLYPSVSVNSRGHIGMVINRGTVKPHLFVALDDDYNGTPPGWEVKLVAGSSYRPGDSVWGDYNTVRPNHPAGVNFVGVGHTLNSNHSRDSRLWFFVFGRFRDRNSWFRWRNR